MQNCTHPPQHKAARQWGGARQTHCDRTCWKTGRAVTPRAALLARPYPQTRSTQPHGESGLGWEGPRAPPAPAGGGVCGVRFFSLSG